MPEYNVTPMSVVRNLMDLARQLAELATGLDELEQRAVEKREDLTLAQAKAFLSAHGPVDVRKNEAIVATHVERLAAETAEALVRGRKRQLDSLKVRIDVGRSAQAALRAEIDLERAR
jgi:hypothetical protein